MPGTLKTILLPSTTPIPAGCTRIIYEPADLDTSGLVNRWVIDDLVADATGNVSYIPPRVGALKLVPPYAANSPAIVTGPNSLKVLQTTIAEAQRLVLEPAPAGAAWPGLASNAFTFFLPFKTLDTTATPKGLCNLFGMQVREYSGANVQIQRAYAGGTLTYTSAYVTTGWTVLCITGDFTTATPVVTIWRDAIPGAPNASVNWTAMITSVALIGSAANPGTPSNAQFGSPLMYNKVKTSGEIAAITASIKARYNNFV